VPSGERLGVRGNFARQHPAPRVLELIIRDLVIDERFEQRDSRVSTPVFSLA